MTIATSAVRKKRGKICFGLDFNIPEALLSSDPQVQGSAIPGRFLVMQSTGLELPGAGGGRGRGGGGGEPCSSQDYLRSNPQAPG